MDEGGQPPNEESDEESVDESNRGSVDPGDVLALDDRTLRMLRRNDPKLTSLFVDGPPEGEMAVLAGHRISKHTHLKNLYIEGFNEVSSDIMAFFRGIGGNTSIEFLSISDSEQCDEIFTSSFFAKNSNLRHLVVSNCFMTRNSTRSLAAGLSKCRDSSLGIFEYDHNGDNDDEGDAELIGALNDKLCLTKLSLQHETNHSVGYTQRCNALQSLLQNPNSSLEKLDLSNYNIFGESASVLKAGLENSKSLRCLILAGSFISTRGWIELSEILRNPNSALEILNIGQGSIDHDGVLAFANSLPQNKTLKFLDLSGCPNVMPDGWLRFIAALKQTDLVLEELNLDHNRMNDQVVASIIDLATNMKCKLMTLKLGYLGAQVSVEGWNKLSLGMANPNFRLRELCVNDCNINDATVTTFANALLNNTSLYTLRLDGNDITSSGWAALSKLLCDTSSINATYSSNHTLQGVYLPDFDPENENDDKEPPMDIVSQLEMNNYPNKREVSRWKIIKYHFTDDTSNIDIAPFVDMELGVLSFAIAWIGRDDNGLLLLHMLLRGMPGLVDFEGKTAYVSLVEFEAGKLP